MFFHYTVVAGVGQRYHINDLSIVLNIVWNTAALALRLSFTL